LIIPIYLLYLLLPIVLLIVGAFGDSWSNTLLPTGFTLKWFEAVWLDTSFRRAFVNSFVVAACTCVTAILLATPLAYALHHRSGKAIVGRVVALLPVAVPALTLGFGYVLVFSADPFPWLGSLPLLVAAHTVLTLPYLTQTLLADLDHMKMSVLEQSAATLGATPLTQFVTISVPLLRHSLVTGSVMVVALSIGEFQLSNLVASFQHRTYPIVLLQAFYGATGYACAATVLLLVLALFGAAFSSNHTKTAL
jgi:putative spermidine/putrescine transport system permease protein